MSFTTTMPSNLLTFCSFLLFHENGVISPKGAKSACLLRHQQIRSSIIFINFSFKLPILNQEKIPLIYKLLRHLLQYIYASIAQNRSKMGLSAWHLRRKR